MVPISWSITGGRVKRKETLTEALDHWDSTPDALKQRLSSQSLAISLTKFFRNIYLKQCQHKFELPSGVFRLSFCWVSMSMLERLSSLGFIISYLTDIVYAQYAPHNSSFTTISSRSHSPLDLFTQLINLPIFERHRSSNNHDRRKTVLMLWALTGSSTESRPHLGLYSCIPVSKAIV